MFKLPCSVVDWHKRRPLKFMSWVWSRWLIYYLDFVKVMYPFIQTSVNSFYPSFFPWTSFYHLLSELPQPPVQLPQDSLLISDLHQLFLSFLFPLDLVLTVFPAVGFASGSRRISAGFVLDRSSRLGSGVGVCI